MTYKTFARKLIKYNHFVDFNDTASLTHQLLGVLSAHALLPVLGLPPLADLVLQLLAVLLLEAPVRRVPVIMIMNLQFYRSMQDARPDVVVDCLLDALICLESYLRVSKDCSSDSP